LVLSESERIAGVQTTLAAVERTGIDVTRPFRLDTAVTATIVLTAREKQYTLNELVQLSPRTAVRDDSGAIDVLEHIIVAAGASLLISIADTELVRLHSAADGFTSIVAAGGSLSVRGEPGRPLRLVSWNPTSNANDLQTLDGRAYIRAFGGRADLVNATVENMGFWSGTTGGLSLTGTRMLTGSEPEAASEAATLSEATGDEIVPLEAELETLPFSGEEPELGYASGLVQSVSLIGNAFGLFVSSSSQVEVRDTLVKGSLVDGIVFHRDVNSSAIFNTTSTDNNRDGIRIARSTSSVVIDRATVSDNGRNGITLDGRPLANGPSAIGLPVQGSGDNYISASTVTDNGRTGIAVIDGDGIEIRNNVIARNDLGIVVSDTASSVIIADNKLTEHPRQAISVRGLASGIIIEANRIDGATTGVMMRESSGEITGNTIAGVTIHGVSLIGETGSSIVVDNRIAGMGPSAVDVIRTSGAAVRANDVTDWRDTKPLAVVLATMFQPLTILWIAIGAFVLLGAVFGSRRRVRGIHDPFADRAPLSSMTRGIVARESVGA
jgi:parallel beta-helix repeat protein